MSYWLMKTEPETFSVDDLAKAPRKTSMWDGVRNFQARNMLRDEMQKGDEAFLYHSSCAIPGIVGIVEIVKTGYPDPTAFDAKHHHYDPESDRNAPRWYVVDVRLKRRLQRVITLDELRKHEKTKLDGMLLLRRGNRLSITPVDAKHWKFITSLEGASE
jgi:predicted RNA-binding protein with PUA-like domain